MADQPIPDFSQNQQFAPGFQAQQPIPGISSSFPQQQQQFPQFQQMNPMVQQQADQITVQSMVTSRTTMALAQQNLMQSMQVALMGTMGAFTDMSRRGGAMITSMSPAGRYNDMLAPNQNWALESSFRREIGFGLSNAMGLDPYNSTMSRLIQGRRPEFLTEGEYDSTMKIASHLRTNNFLKGAASIGLSGSLTMGTSALGLGLGASIALPMVGGLIGDRLIEAEFAEREDEMKMRLMVKNKRMGIGQQFMKTDQASKMHSAFYETDNPFGSRFFGDNAIGNAFKPDVQKLKIFDNAANSGMLSFENLDADNVIKYVNKIAADVEKYSRIGKVTRESYQKILANIKSTGIHGADMFTSAKNTAHISSMTGIDMEQLSGIQDNAALIAQSMGMDNFSARENMGQIVSGFAMMQKAGAFQNKNIMQMSQGMFNYSMTNSRTALGMMGRYGGLDGAYKNLGRLGNGDYAYGMVVQNALDLPGKDPVETWMELARQNKWDFKTTQKYIFSDPNLSEEQKGITARAYAVKYFGLTDVAADVDRVDNFIRLQGRERTSNVYDVRDLGTTSRSRKAESSFFRNVHSYSLDPASEAYMKTKPGYQKTREYIKEVLGKYDSITSDNLYSLTRELSGLTKEDIYNIYGMIEEIDPKKWAQIKSADAKQERDLGSGTFDAMINLMKKGSKNDLHWYQNDMRPDTAGAIFRNALMGAGKEKEFIERVRGVYDSRKGSFKNIGDLIGSIRGIAIDLKLDQKLINDTFGDKSLRTGFFSDSSEKNVMSLMSHMSYNMKIEESDRDTAFNKYQMRMATDLGFTKDGRVDYKRYNKSIKRIQDFREKYYDEAGGLKKNALEGDNSLTQEYISDVKSIASSKGDERKVAELYFGKSLDRMKELGDFRSPDSAKILGQSLIGKNRLQLDPEDVRRAEQETKKQAEADPSDEAVKSLNILLGKILKAMGVSPTQKEEAKK
jgi:hypothetical protein